MRAVDLLTFVIHINIQTNIHYMPMRLNSILKPPSKIKGKIKLHVIASISQELYQFVFHKLLIETTKMLTPHCMEGVECLLEDTYWQCVRSNE